VVILPYILNKRLASNLQAACRRLWLIAQYSGSKCYVRALQVRKFSRSAQWIRLLTDNLIKSVQAKLFPRFLSVFFWSDVILRPENAEAAQDCYGKRILLLHLQYHIAVTGTVIHLTPDTALNAYLPCTLYLPNTNIGASFKLKLRAQVAFSCRNLPLHTPRGLLSDSANTGACTPIKLLDEASTQTPRSLVCHLRPFSSSLSTGTSIADSGKEKVSPRSGGQLRRFALPSVRFRLPS